MRMSKYKFTVDEELRKSISDRFGDGVMLLDSPAFDRSIIGVDAQSGRAVYDYSKTVMEFAEDNSCGESEAEESICHNTIGALPYAGEGAPIVIEPLEGMRGERLPRNTCGERHAMGSATGTPRERMRKGRIGGRGDRR